MAPYPRLYHFLIFGQINTDILFRRVNYLIPTPSYSVSLLCFNISGSKGGLKMQNRLIWSFQGRESGWSFADLRLDSN